MVRQAGYALLALDAIIGLGTKAYAQAPASDPGVLSLPRPGYEPRGVFVGPTELHLQGDVILTYDSNVYAAPSSRQDDAALQPSARLTLSRVTGRTRFDGDAHIARTQFFRLSRENSTTFGLSARGRSVGSGGKSLVGQLFYDRVIESRADPEAPPAAQLPPRRIDTAGVEGQYIVEGAHFSVELSGALRVFNYLAPEEADRDMQSYESNARLSYRFAGATSLFIEPYVVRRQFTRRVDFSGTDRDATTVGALAGLSRDVTAKLNGRLGIGFYRFTPDDGDLPPATGFAAQGSLNWTPRRRTSWTLSVMSGDVATVRAGATGRQDSRATLRLDQEVRHNLLFAGEVSWTRNKYRAAPNLDRETSRASAELTLLMTRSIGIVARGSYMHRTADDPLNAFNRAIVSIGLQLRQ
jgi:hypothetical protein